MVNTIRENIEFVRKEIRDSAKISGRSGNDILLVAVTKTRPVEDILEAVRCGVSVLGENRVQELLEKHGRWPWDVPVQWRLIGHLQRNKVRKALSVASFVDSVDSLDLARVLSRVAAEQNKIVPVLLEVNTSGETSKNGVAPEEVNSLLEGILRECPALVVEGFMTIGPLSNDEREVRNAFSHLWSIREKARKNFNLSLLELSMGMSGDFRWAVLEGSTMVRIGSAIFGARE